MKLSTLTFPAALGIFYSAHFGFENIFTSEKGDVIFDPTHLFVIKSFCLAGGGVISAADD